MSDITIPGVTSKYNTQKIIKDLVDAERIPLKRMEKSLKDYKQKKKIWQDINRKLSTLRDDAKGLYSFDNPFNQKVATSSDESILTATAERTAIKEEKEITIKQIATSDRFKSNSLSRDFKIPKGKYTFKVGDKRVSFDFSGGSLEQFAKKINRRARGVLRASVVKDTPDTYIIAIESLKTGVKNKLIFQDKAVEFGIQAGIFERINTTEKDININKYSIEPWTKKITEKTFSLSDGVLTLNPGGELKIPVNPPFKINPNMVLQFKLKTEKLPEKQVKEIKPPPGPTIPDSGKIEFKGIEIKNETLKVLLPQWKPPKPPEKIEDMHILYLETEDKTVTLKPIEDSNDFRTYKIDLGKLKINSVKAINLRNRNTYRKIDITEIKLYDKTARGKYKPLHPISQAADAKLKIDGIEVERPSNTIDDLIPGIKLHIKAPSEKPVKLKIDVDKEGIKNSIIKLIGHYNQVITEIDVVSRRDENIIEDAKYLSDEEREDYKKKLGALMGDISMLQLKSRLQSIMMNPYKTEGGRQLSLLAHIGISTDTRKPGSAATLDKTRLRGYLEIDEDKLDDALNEHPEWVKELFGYDTDGDLVVDSGIAYSLDRELKTYVQTGGIIATRLSNLDNQISRKNRDIESYNEHLKDYEQQLKNKFGRMEGALEALQKSSQAIQNLGRNNNKQ